MAGVQMSRLTVIALHKSFVDLSLVACVLRSGVEKVCCYGKCVSSAEIVC